MKGNLFEIPHYGAAFEGNAIAKLIAIGVTRLYRVGAVMNDECPAPVFASALDYERIAKTSSASARTYVTSVGIPISPYGYAPLEGETNSPGGEKARSLGCRTAVCKWPTRPWWCHDW